MNEPQPDQDLPYTETEIESMTTDDAHAGKILTLMMVCTFCYTVVVIVFYSHFPERFSSNTVPLGFNSIQQAAAAR